MKPANLPANDAFLLADWDRVLMIHFEVDAAALQPETPFALDLWEGRAFVSLVAFTMRGMRLRCGGALGRWLLLPIATHEFLNVRTYLRGDDVATIQFLAEWLPNRLSCWLGPRCFSLPYHLGKLRYDHRHETGTLAGEVTDARSCRTFRYRARVPVLSRYHPCAAGSRDAWLMERYAACNAVGGRRRKFQVRHEPWSQTSAVVELLDMGLLETHWTWFRHARCVGANYSPGLRNVQMGRPHRICAIPPR
jgi:uncharacterized protein YqjF (DUF2071 family)